MEEIKTAVTCGVAAGVIVMIIYGFLRLLGAKVPTFSMVSVAVLIGVSVVFLAAVSVELIEKLGND